MAVDMDLKKAFEELHEKIKNTSQKIHLTDMQIDTLKRSQHHNNLTIEELEKIPKDEKTYESLGRAFVLTPKDEVFENLNKANKETKQKILILENTKRHLELSVKDSENNLREMVQRKREVIGNKDKPSTSKK